MKVEADIRKAEIELREVKAVHHPAVASLLQKEKPYLFLEGLELVLEQNMRDQRRKFEDRQ
jgi:hypothetical protein